MRLGYHERVRASSAAWVVWALLLGSCAPSAVDLVVDLRTDLLPGAEFGRVRVIVQPGDTVEANASLDADYVDGVRTAELSDLEPGLHDVFLTLFEPTGAPLIEQRVIVELERDTVLTVVLTRDCRDVACGEDERCLRGACVDSECSALNPDRCPAPECMSDGECGSTSSCAIGRCVEGSCLLAVEDAMCDAGDRCDPDRGCVSMDDRAVRIVSPAGLDLPYGGSRPLEVTLEGGWVDGDTLTLSAPPTTLDLGGVQSPEVELQAPLDPGTIVSIKLPFDAAPGSTIDLVSSAALVGDTSFTVVEPVPGDVMIDGASYQVTDGFLLEAPLALDAASRVAMTDRLAQLVFPPPGSAFADEPYLALAGDTDMGMPVEVVRVVGGGLSTFASSDGMSGPDANFSQVAFSEPGSPWGDFLYICSASFGGGDGVFRLDSTGTFASFWSFNNCNGLAFDYGQVFGDPGFPSPMLVNENSEDFVRVDPSSGQEVLVGAPFSFNGSGFQIHIPQDAPWAGRAYFITPRDGDDEGRVWRIDAIDPWGTPELWLDGLPRPAGSAVAFTAGGRLGERLYVAMRQTGTVRAYRADGTFTDVLSGLVSPSGVTHRDDSLWIVDRGTGQVLRLSP